ncbi:hypothetical protein E2C01_005280 [Portunus trituberculatus]|uniref:Uncharacterized protein n=1 Tax=Portunus trituberculatus TaxID=210409 RepID=A0A5B7CT38_PORTR|nr:hypothetical protein [Portunus trituberculatus]
MRVKTVRVLPKYANSIKDKSNIWRHPASARQIPDVAAVPPGNPPSPVPPYKPASSNTFFIIFPNNNITLPWKMECWEKNKRKSGEVFDRKGRKGNKRKRC